MISVTREECISPCGLFITYKTDFFDEDESPVGSISVTSRRFPESSDVRKKEPKADE